MTGNQDLAGGTGHRAAIGLGKPEPAPSRGFFEVGGRKIMVKDLAGLQREQTGVDRSG